MGIFNFDQVMKEYFNCWKFKYLVLEDLRDVLMKYNVDLLVWFFEGILGSIDYYDYVIKKVK